MRGLLVMGAWPRYSRSAWDLLLLLLAAFVEEVYRRSHRRSTGASRPALKSSYLKCRHERPEAKGVRGRGRESDRRGRTRMYEKGNMTWYSNETMLLPASAGAPFHSHTGSISVCTTTHHLPLPRSRIPRVQNNYTAIPTPTRNHAIAAGAITRMILARKRGARGNSISAHVHTFHGAAV